MSDCQTYLFLSDSYLFTQNTADGEVAKQTPLYISLALRANALCAISQVYQTLGRKQLLYQTLKTENTQPILLKTEKKMVL